MAEIVNLRRTRKSKRRAEKDAEAAGNRQLHGLPKSSAAKTRLTRALDTKRLEAHRRDGNDDSSREP